ncbi:MAG: hypothetical protein Q8N47_19265 [Bryobacterales bacterium]|nr:hypothetical protein [Bryobacterales bacterium]
MTNDAQFFEQALARINAWMLALMIAGTAGAGWIAGLQGLTGFFLGAAVSYFYFRWIKQVVDALAPGARPPRKRILVLLVLRYAIFGAAGYYLAKFTGISLPAALAGLSVSVAAVLAEIAYELATAKAPE